MDIIKNCFKKCVYAFNSDKFVNSEEDCVKECVEQYKKRIKLIEDANQ